MPNISHGPRRKTRHKLSRDNREKTSLTQRLQSFESGDHVTITIDSSIHQGMPHPRFHGCSGEVTGKQGSSYIVTVETGTGAKQVIVHPAHLTPSGDGGD